mmetsp:Transcript_96764/g.167975  ORF Transcript_96764/g.167975 Transcript_96764/m.167975 type:complete len:581 (-) Transcript_96764:47-1789(-)
MKILALVLACFACTGKGQGWQSYLDCLQSSSSADSCKMLETFSSIPKVHPSITQRLSPSKAAALIFLSLDPRAAFQASGLGRTTVTTLQPPAGALRSMPTQAKVRNCKTGNRRVIVQKKPWGSVKVLKVRKSTPHDFRQEENAKRRERRRNMEAPPQWKKPWQEQQFAEFKELFQQQAEAFPESEVIPKKEAPEPIQEWKPLTVQVSPTPKSVDREDIENPPGQRLSNQELRRLTKEANDEQNSMTGRDDKIGVAEEEEKIELSPEDEVMHIGRVFIDACNLGVGLVNKPNGPPQIATVPGLNLLLAVTAPEDAPITAFFDGKHTHAIAGSDWTYRDIDDREVRVVFTDAHEKADDVLMRHLYNASIGESLPIPISAEEAIQLYESTLLPVPAVIATRHRRKTKVPYQDRKDSFLKRHAKLRKETGNKAHFLGLTNFMRGQTLGMLRGLVNLGNEDITFERCRGPLTLVITDDLPLKRRCLAMRPPAVVIGRKQLFDLMKIFTDGLSDLSEYANDDEDEESGVHWDDDSDDDITDLSDDDEPDVSPEQEPEVEQTDEEPAAQDFASFMLARARRRQKATA